MIKRFNKKFMLLLAIVSIFFMMPKLYAASYNVYTVRYKCKVRTSASDSASVIKNGNDDVNVYPDMELDYIKTVKGPNNGKSNQDWYAVKFDYAAREYTGYVAKACMYDTKTYSYSDDSSFESSISSFPDSYKPYLRKLHAIYPNWTFKADYTNLNWNTAAEAESQIGQSAISYLYPSLRYTNSLYPNGIVVDGTSWYAPCMDAVKYFMDPRNFINSKNIFMFKALSYNSNEDSSVSEILDGSFMSGSFTENGYTKKYSDAFIEAAKENNISSVFLASRALQELGTTKPKQVTGTVSGYEGYYNFYNIGAYSGADNYLKGLAYAKTRGWNTILGSIKGGASEIASGYIKLGQDTTYYQKFNVASYKTRNAYTHEYQTNIMAPKTESESVYSSYKANNKLNYGYTFIIPVYNNRPDSAFKVSKTNTVGGSTPVTTDTNQSGNQSNNSSQTSSSSSSSTNTTKPVSVSTKISNAGYALTSGYLTKIPVGTDMSTIRSKLTNAGATVASVNSNWNSKTSGKVATGDIVEIDKNNRYEVVVYGDVSGEGTIDIKDLLIMKKYLLGEMNLSGAKLQAARISKDSNVTIKELLLLKKYLLGNYNIEW